MILYNYNYKSNLITWGNLEGPVVEVGPGDARDEVEPEAAHGQAVPARCI